MYIYILNLYVNVEFGVKETFNYNILYNIYVYEEYIMCI